MCGWLGHSFLKKKEFFFYCISFDDSQVFIFVAAPSSPVQPIQLQNRRLLSVRMNSVELPDDNEKSQSSASASPCPSPVYKEILLAVNFVCWIFNSSQSLQKTQRLLPTNLYVVLFNFKGREADELDLKYRGGMDHLMLPWAL